MLSDYNLVLVPHVHNAAQLAVSLNAAQMDQCYDVMQQLSFKYHIATRKYVLYVYITMYIYFMQKQHNHTVVYT